MRDEQLHLPHRSPFFTLIGIEKLPIEKNVPLLFEGKSK